VANFIRVSGSSIERGNPAELVSRQPSELWTKDVPASWFMIDLGKGRSVIPTHYTLRHGGMPFTRLEETAAATAELSPLNGGR
jgi:hypothetical protein